MRLIDADLALGEMPNEIKDYAYWLKEQPTVFDIDQFLEKLDKRISIQLKILAGLDDEVDRYVCVKSLETYQQCKLILEELILEY